MSRVSWTDEEVVALKRGVGKYGAGNWAPILLDDEFGPILFARTNVNIKVNCEVLTETSRVWVS